MPTRSTSLPRREPQPETTDIVVSRPFLTGLVEEMNHDDLEAGRPQLQRPSQDDGFRRPSTIPVAVQGINQQRIEALSQTVYRERRTGVIGNMIFLISAVLIGIFVGFIFLRYMWPEFFSRGSGYNVGYDAGFEGVEFK